LSTLSQLKVSVDSWLARDDVAVSNSDFPQILLIAESEISRDVHTLMQQASVTVNFTGREADLPYDFLELRNVFVDDNIRKTEYMTPEAIRESTAWTNGRAGSFFTLEGNLTVAGDERVKIVIATAASAAAPLAMEVLYKARFAALVNDPDTNWLLVNHYDIYLYATLRAACEYIQEFEREDRYMGKYERAIEKQAKHENRKRFGANPKQAYADPRGVV